MITSSTILFFALILSVLWVEMIISDFMFAYKRPEKEFKTNAYWIAFVASMFWVAFYYLNN